MDFAAVSGIGRGSVSSQPSGFQPSGPSRSDVDNFQQLLSPGASSSGPQSASAVTATGEGNLSNGLREGIKQAAEAYRSRFESLKDGLKKVEKTNSISGLLAWQLDSVKMGVEMEFTGKIASKLVQDIEQLTKQQG